MCSNLIHQRPAHLISVFAHRGSYFSFSLHPRCNHLHRFAGQFAIPMVSFLMAHSWAMQNTGCCSETETRLAIAFGLADGYVCYGTRWRGDLVVFMEMPARWGLQFAVEYISCILNGTWVWAIRIWRSDWFASCENLISVVKESRYWGCLKDLYRSEAALWEKLKFGVEKVYCYLGTLFLK